MKKVGDIFAALGGMFLSFICILLDAMRERPPGPELPPDQRFREHEGQ